MKAQKKEDSGDEPDYVEKKEDSGDESDYVEKEGCERFCGGSDCGGCEEGSRQDLQCGRVYD